jgi:hypothetical protein
VTKERRLLITSGAALIALIIAVAAYSLGVYSGVQGWASGPPSVAGPGRRPLGPAGQDPAPQGQQPQPGRQQSNVVPQLVGQVQSESDEGITLNTPRGPRQVRLAPGVVVLRRAQGRLEPAALEEVQPGEHLAAFGRFQASGQGQLVAEQLVLLPPPP